MADLTSNEQTGMKDSTMEADVKEQVKSLSGAVDKNPIQVAGRVFGALEYLTSAGTAGLMEISTALGLNKSTTRRVLCSLEYMGYVRQNELTGRYEPTFKIVDLAGRVLQKLDIIELVRPYLKELMEQCGETVHLVKMEGADVIYVDKVEAYHYNFRMASRIGSSIPFRMKPVSAASRPHWICPASTASMHSVFPCRLCAWIMTESGSWQGRCWKQRRRSTRVSGRCKYYLFII